jgi:hypothetical protein
MLGWQALRGPAGKWFNKRFNKPDTTRLLHRQEPILDDHTLFQ